MKTDNFQGIVAVNGERENAVKFEARSNNGRYAVATYWVKIPTAIELKAFDLLFQKIVAERTDGQVQLDTPVYCGTDSDADLFLKTGLGPGDRN